MESRRYAKLRTHHLNWTNFNARTHNWHLMVRINTPG